MLVHQPGQTTVATNDRLISFVDLAPTLYRRRRRKPTRLLARERFSRTIMPRDYIYASRDRIDEVIAVNERYAMSALNIFAVTILKYWRPRTDYRTIWIWLGMAQRFCSR